MAKEKSPAPVNYKGVMVSSTFSDLEKHRDALMKALQKEELFANMMEGYVPPPGDDIISSSLGMVRKASAYIGIISHRCGNIPEDSKRNPNGYSITRLEFEEAQRLGLPTLVFIMGNRHQGTREDFEYDPEKIKKLDDFRRRAKEGRIYEIFESLEDFIAKAIHSVAKLHHFLDEQDNSASQPSEEAAPTNGAKDVETIPTPPAFYVEPPYIGSHRFLGRKAQLDIINDWAAPADPHPILLFEAIGGMGKSILTWEWVTKHATEIRDDWAGCFWYSFYQRGATMANFCGRALAYITGRSFDDFKKKKTPELADRLLRLLREKPWLIVLEGLERILVTYQSYDAAQIAEEETCATNQIAKRDPCAAILPEDDELLRALTGAAPSKFLLTSRLIPRVLLNASDQPIPGIHLERLPGLHPSEAEELIRACGVTGESKAIQDYLQKHCDCHPLVTGALAGLINDYLPDRGNFDAWAADPNGGGKLNLAELNLVQKRNHILETALAALDEKSRQLLSTLALLSVAVDYPTLSAFNPHQLPEPNSNKELEKTVFNLERRGLLQYDPNTKHYDLHPVVRGIVAGQLSQDKRKTIGQRVVDYFSQRPHSPYQEAETVEDVRDGLNIVRTLIQMGQYRQALDVYSHDLAYPLYYNLEAYSDILSILHTFPTEELDVYERIELYDEMAHIMNLIGMYEESFAACGAVLQNALEDMNFERLKVVLHNISMALWNENRPAKAERCILFSFEITNLQNDIQVLFRIRLSHFALLMQIGRWKDAEAMWNLLDPMGRDWSPSMYRPGTAEHLYALFCFWQGHLHEEHLVHARQLAESGKNRFVIRNLHVLRGEWHLEQGRYMLAAESLHESVRMAREVGLTDEHAEALLALAKYQLGQLPDARDEVERLAKAKTPPHRTLARLWLEIGDSEQAKKHALAAYKWAWADGEPYVHRYELDKSRALLEKLGVEIPDLPVYDPAKDEKFPWEDDVVAAIEKLKAKKEAEKAAKKRKKISRARRQF